MFTGIVTAIGTVTSSEQRGDLRVTVSCPYDPAQSPSAPPLPVPAPA